MEQQNFVEVDAKWKQWTCREHYIEQKILYDYLNLHRFLLYRKYYKIMK